MPQNFPFTALMNPIRPRNPSGRQYAAGPFPHSSGTSAAGPYCPVIARSTSVFGTLFMFRAAPTGISSMNRTSTGISLASPASCSGASSFMPRCTTQLILTGSLPAARRIEASTRSSSSRPVIFRYCSRSRVSRLMFTASIPARSRSSSCSASSTPLVVSATCRTPGIPFSMAASAAQFFRTRGSPPVILNRSIPSAAAWAHTKAISSYRRSSSMGSRRISSGMQYLQRRLHRSVTEIRI